MSDHIRITPRIQPVRLPLAARLGVAGRIAVSKVDRSGNRVPVRIDRSRRAWQRVWDHEQANLVLDQGLDFLLSHSTAQLRFHLLHNYVAVSTDSVEPEEDDTVLAGEIARTNSTLSLGTNGEGSEVSAGVLQYRRVRAFDFNEANGNLTKFGGASAASGELRTAELFRDEEGDPVTITKTNEERLVITYDILVSRGPTAMTAADPITVTGIGEVLLEQMAYRGYGGNGADTSPLFGSAVYVMPATNIVSTYDNAGIPGIPTGLSSSSAPGGASVDEYVGGSYERTLTTVYGPQVSAASIAGFALYRPSSTNGGRTSIFGWQFTSPATIEKSADYRLTLAAKLAVSRT